MMEKLKFVDLFSGTGGIRQGFERNGHKCIAFSEIDKYAITAYKTLYGDDDIELGDVSQISDEELGLMSEEVGLVVGGSPCQAFSIAGRRGGFSDVRGSLFFEYCRVLKQTQPKFFLFENVKGLLSSDKGKTIDTVIRTFNEVGYTVDFNIMNSKYFDVPQNRERVFAIGVRNDLIDHEEWVVTGTGVLAKAKKRLIEEGDIRTFNFDWPKQEVVSKRLKDILEANVDEKFYLDDAKTEMLVNQLKERQKEKAPVILHNIYGGFKEEGPRVFEDVSPTIRTAAGGGHLPSLLEVDTREKVVGVGHHPFSKKKEFNGYDSEISPCLIATDYKAPKTVLEQHDPIVIDPSHAKREGKHRIYEEIAPTLQARDYKEPRLVGQYEEEPKINVVGNIKPPEATRLGQRDDVYGDDGLMGALNATDYKQPRTIYGEKTRYRIRKLTPKECWRLQSFSDEDFDKVQAVGISNTQLYKLAGNGVTINVIDALAKNINELHKTLSKRNIKVYNKEEVSV